MQKNNEQKTETTIEKKLAYWLDSFTGHLEFIPNAQQHLHDCLLSLDEQIYNKKEKKVIAAFLNSALSLTFIIKDNNEKVEDFIQYQTKD